MYCSLNRAALALLLCVVPTICHASIEISFTDSGWYRINGTNSGANPNNIVQANGSNQNRNFFVFDLAGVTNTILGGTLRLENPQAISNGVASTYTLYDVSTDIASLMASQSGTAIYTDLGSGVVYGSVALSSSISPGIVEIPLNATAIAAMNATSGLFALGGALSVIGSTQAQLFTGTSGPEYVRTLRLELEQPTLHPGGNLVPEPMSVLVWSGIAMVGGLGALVRRKAECHKI